MKNTKTILLIDDDFATNYLHQYHITKLGLFENIVCATNGEEAINLLFDENNKPLLRPDLIFTDINMPLMNGWEFLKAYSEKTNCDSCRIVMLTSSIDPSDQLKASKNKYLSSYIKKPLSPSCLAELITSLNCSLETS
jgi:CheY-like chemotaxis protein